MGIDKDFYNQASASKLGWSPDWFGCDAFDADLVSAVKKWQKSYGLSADGLVGPVSYRRKWTERQAEIDDYLPASHSKKDQNFIVHNSNFLPIKWDKVVLWSDENGFKSNSGTYYDYAGKPDRLPTHFVNHWDVCLNSASCAKVLNRRGVSVHFLIDNDGTIYQMLDTQHGGGMLVTFTEINEV